MNYEVRLGLSQPFSGLTYLLCPAVYHRISICQVSVALDPTFLVRPPISGLRMNVNEPRSSQITEDLILRDTPTTDWTP